MEQQDVPLRFARTHSRSKQKARRVNVAGIWYNLAALFVNPLVPMQRRKERNAAAEPVSATGITGPKYTGLPSAILSPSFFHWPAKSSRGIKKGRGVVARQISRSNVAFKRALLSRKSAGRWYAMATGARFIVPIAYIRVYVCASVFVGRKGRSCNRSLVVSWWIMWNHSAAWSMHPSLAAYLEGLE